ncbi:MAG: prepilin-type N-terminal cleavage/methylation domain-containing protein [Thermoanaerobaculia bacterium]|nr:prepilin-type N-terminal cleavage/methylation domain-containing protein [Thermoanaerobaculia bacterium]
MFLRNRQKGFTLIELLIVVAIIGIIAAILIPNLLDALQKAKQKRTVSDMRNVGTAWMSWLTDQVSAASAGQSGGTGKYDATNHNSVDYADLAVMLTPSKTFFYMQNVPALDGWKHTYSYGRASNLLDAAVMIICSSGRDTDYETGVNCIGGEWTVGSYIATDYDNDIVWADGFFVLGPGGLTQAATP